MKKILLLTLSVTLGISTLFAQQRVTGTVTSTEDDGPLPYVTVVVAGTTITTQTNLDGAYAITVPAGNNAITFSYVGMQTVTVELNGRAIVDVVMEPDAVSLDDVIVVAYGTQRKSSFTGAASQVSGETIKKMQVSNISKSLEGSMSGVQTTVGSGTPGSGSSIIIRGIGSISASQEPLIVVDGVAYSGSLNSIPTQDIESLTVLKDANANSMYGARGSNGVIIITTKSSKTGKAQINFEARYGLNRRGVPAYDVIGAEDAGAYYEMMYESISNSLVEAGYSRMYANQYVSQNLISGYLKYNVFKNVNDNELIDPTTGKITDAARSRKWTDNWATDPFSSELRQEYNLSISGGSENTKAYASVSYLDDAGYVVNSSFNRIAGRVKLDQQIGKFIKAGANLAYANTVQNQFGSTDSNYSNIFMFSQNIGPIYPIYLYDESGQKILDAKGNERYDYGTEYSRPYAMEQNPYATAKEGLNEYKADQITSRAYVEVKFLKDFKFTANLAYDVRLNNNVEFATPIGGDALSVGGRGYRTSTRNAVINANQLLNWAPTYGQHSINLLLGHETNSSHYQYFTGHMTKFVVNDVPDFANALVYQDMTSYTSEYALEGYFSRLEYDFADKYYLSASYRMDASSRFHPDVRWGNFWSAGASWRINEEGFMQGVRAINNLKLKASYGTQGNDNVGFVYAYLDQYRIDRVNGEAGMVKTFRGNPDLTWEKSHNLNVGLEVGVWNRLNVTADFFIKETRDMIYFSPLPPSQGSPNGIWSNEMDMKNTGFEMEISGDIIKSKNVTWNIALNATHYKNELTRLPEDKDPEGYASGSYWRKLGGSLYDWYTYEWAGVDPATGLPQYNSYDEDDNVTIVNLTSAAQQRQTGKSAIPDLYGGLTSTLNAYGFDLTISTAFQLGGWVMDSYYRSLMNGGDSGSNFHTDMFNRWTPNNTNTSIPALNYQNMEVNASSDRWLTKASYFSLRNVTLGYTFPEAWMKRANIGQLRVYVVGDNIWMRSARKGLDPRQSFSGSTGYVYSALSTYSVGLSLSF